MIHRHSARIFLLLFCLLGLVACSALPGKVADREASPKAADASAAAAGEFYWWRARFVTPLAEDEEPRLVSDLMVADLVVEPVIQEYASSLALWRFHRRAVHDDGGHVFSFIFYADRQAAEQVFAAIDKSPALARLLRHGLIGKYENDLAEENSHGSPGATSDPNWSKPLQEVWPVYIMGASVTWLGLINQHIDATDAAERDFSELVADYEKVDAALGELWREEGQHAFLHHLNALFGYGPMRLQVETSF